MKKIYITLALLIITLVSFSQTRYYVNDNSTVGDVFTTAIGNDANSGSSSAPLASIITAYLRTQPGDTIFVDAGTYTADGTIGRSLTILGTNYPISPNNPADPLLPNTGRNAESIITNSTWTIAANNVNLEGLTFDPNSRTAVRTTNVSNIRLSKNRFKINASNTHISFTGVGNFNILTSEIVNSGFTVTDNRFEKYDPSNGVTLNINRVKNVTITNNSFVTPGATLRTQLILSAGTGGLTDGIVFSNNTVDKAATTIGNGASANMVITGNKIYNTIYALRVDYSMPESSNFIFSNNLLDGGSGISPFIQFIKRGGFAAGSSSSFKAENNTITGNAIASVSSLMRSFYVAFTNSVLNPSLTLRRNKISYTGDYSTTNGQDISPFVLAGNINNANIDNNEITLSGINMQPRNPINNLPLCPAISLYPENGSGGVIQPGATINILNNKIEGFKQSFVVFDPFDIVNGGVDNYTGYGNLNPLALLKVNYNSFTNDSMSVNNGDNFDNDLDVHCNWYGSSADQDIIKKISYQSITAIPWLTNGNDNDPAIGFQPLNNVCNGTPPLVVLEGYSNVTCNGAHNGTINISVSNGLAPYTFNWTKDGDPGFSSANEDPANLSPGTYHLALMDALGSTIYVDANTDIISIAATITEPPLLTSSVAGTTNICSGSLGTATATAAGGTSPYTYLWSNGATTATISSLAPGTYSVTVTDAHGCTSTSSITMTGNAAIDISICAGITRTIYRGTTNGDGPFGPQSVNLSSSANGGTPGYSYSWSPASGLNNAAISNPIASPASTTTYTLTVTDSKGCSRSLSITINVLPLSAAICSTNGNVKFNVCHIPPGNPGNENNICISANALSAHLTTGSNGHNNCHLGPCGEVLCFSTNTGTITRMTTTAEPVYNEFVVKASPNPTASYFVLETQSSNNQTAVTIRVIDISGKQVQAFAGISVGAVFSFGNAYQPGIYIGEVIQGKNRKIIKLVKM